ncbi:MAG TPA: hypothetical protein VM243_14430 [Phycisphaerae bacterium]|nr:hypothetical protein [Phycisphaerae bacterium]
MALLTIDEMTNELNRRMGVQAELLDNQVGSAPTGFEYDVIERALNDALVQTVLRYRHTEFEADKPHFFDNLAVAATDGVTIADSSLVTSSSAAIGLEPDGVTTISTLERWIDGVIQIGGLSYTVTRVTDSFSNVVSPFTPPYRITVAPRVGVAQTSASLFMAARRYPLPFSDGDGGITNPVGATNRIFFIYNLSDITNNSPLYSADVRLNDRSVPQLSQPNYYDRLKNDLFIDPAPFSCSASGGSLAITFKLRYAYRPSYKAGTDTFSPLPEEWQEVVMLEAYGKLLDMENEHDRATSTRAAAAELAAQIMVPFYEEMDDAEPAFIPVMFRQ